MIDRRLYSKVPGRCPLCGAVKPGRLKIARYGLPAYFAECTTCQLIYQNPATSLSASRLYYERLWSDRRARYDKCSDISLIVDVRPPPAKLCDFGAGTGEFVAEAQARGYQAEGIEISVAGRKRALKNYHVVLKPGLDDDAQYDIFCLWATVEHWADPREVLRLARSRLKDDGILFLMTPELEPDNLWAQPGHFCFDHRCLMTANTLDRMLIESGFTSLVRQSHRDGCLWGYAIPRPKWTRKSR